MAWPDNSPFPMKISFGGVSLVGFNEKHLTTKYLNWLNDKSLLRYSEQRKRHHSLDSCRSYMKSFEGTPHCFWAIESTAANGAHIGNMNAYIDESNSVADIGLLVGERSFGRKGCGTAAWMAGCDYLFRYVGIRKITAGTLAANLPMVRVCEKSGMEQDGIRREQAVVGGQALDLLHFCLFRDKWMLRYPRPLAAVEL